MSIDLTPYADAIDHGLAEGSFSVVATQGADGIPDIGYKGSVQVFDKDHLSYWERTLGGHLANLRKETGVAVLYFNRERGMYLRLYGHAELYEEGATREQIKAQTPAGELERDPEDKGIGVLIRVDRLVEAFSQTEQVREGIGAA